MKKVVNIIKSKLSDIKTYIHTDDFKLDIKILVPCFLGTIVFVAISVGLIALLFTLIFYMVG